LVWVVGWTDAGQAAYADQEADAAAPWMDEVVPDTVLTGRGTLADTAAQARANADIEEVVGLDVTDSTPPQPLFNGWEGQNTLVAAFAAPSGASFWNETQYNDYVRQGAAYWETQSQGLVTFTLSTYAQTPVIRSAHICDGDWGGLMNDVAQGLGYASSAAFWAAQPPRTHLLVMRPRPDVMLGCSTISGTNGREISMAVTETGPTMYDWQGLAHELGHDFGLHHTGGGRCPVGVQDARFTPQGATGECLVGQNNLYNDVYNDYLSIMGNANRPISLYGLTGQQKQVLGLISEGQGVKTISAGQGSYRLIPAQQALPIGQATTSIQALTVVDPVAGVPWHYSVQYDQVAGGVTVRRLLRDTPAEDGQVLIDSVILNPKQTNVGNRLAFAAGETLTSASGRFTIAVESISATTASVRVNFASAPSLRTSRTQWTAPTQGATTKEVVWTDGATWTATTSATWLHATPSGTHTGDLELTTTQTTATRTATVTITSGGAQTTIKVDQNPAADDHPSTRDQAALWDVTKQPNRSGRLETVGDEDWFRFTAPSTGLATITAPAPTGNLWLWVDNARQVSTSSNSIGQLVFPLAVTKGQEYRLRVSANTSLATLGAGYTLSARFPIAGALTLTPSSWTAPTTGGHTTVTVTGSAGTTWTATSASRLAQISPSTGQSGQTLTLTVGPNASASTLTDDITVILSNGQATQFRITQPPSTTPTLTLAGQWNIHKAGRILVIPDGYPLVTTTSWKAEREAVQLCGINVRTNQPTWTATPSATWLKPTVASGKSHVDTCLAVDANTTGQDRTTTLTLTAGTATATFTVTQSGAPTVSFNPATTTLPTKGGSATVHVTTIGSPWLVWAPTSSPWLTLDRGGGTAGESFTVTAPTLQSGSARSGTLTLTCAGETITYTVTQRADTPRLSPSLTDSTIPAAGGTLTTTVNSTVGAWNVTDYPDWITPQPRLGGAPGAQLTLTAQPNTGAAREGQIVIRAEQGTALTFTVKQAARPATLLTVTPDSGTIAPGGGTVTVKVCAGQPWKIDSAPSWLSASRTTGPTGAVQVAFRAEAHEGADRSGTVVVSADGATPAYLTITQSGDGTSNGTGADNSGGNSGDRSDLSRGTTDGSPLSAIIEILNRVIEDIIRTILAMFG
jgi:hypothetical protein